MGDVRRPGLVTAGALFAVLSGAAAGHGAGAGLVAHMTEHICLLVVAPLLLALGWSPLRRRATNAPAVAVALAAHIAAMIVWHLPSPFDAAVRSVPLHVAEHATMFATGLLFWVVLLARRNAAVSSLPVLFVASLPGIGLGMAMMLATHPWYRTAPDALGSQQLAGVVMMGFGGFVYLAVALAGFLRWMSALDASAAVAP